MNKSKGSTAQEEKPAKKRKVEEQTPRYAKDEVVFAYSGPLLYEAKIVAVDTRSTTPFYIHYKGWKSSHNEWVAPDQLLKLNEENKKLMKKLQQDYKNHRKSKNKAAKAKLEKGSKSDPNSNDTKDEDDKGMKLNIPVSLKKHLVDDWEKLTQKNLLVKVPRKTTVAMFLNDFLEAKLKKQPQGSVELQEAVEGIRTYFDLALPKVLLYRFERLQYDALMEDNRTKRLSDTYGVEHLLRLFIKLPPLLLQIQISNDDTEKLRLVLQDLIKFLSRRTDKYLEPEAYIKASNDYIYAFQHKLPSVVAQGASHDMEKAHPAEG